VPVPADLSAVKVVVDPGPAAPAEASNPGGFGDAGAVILHFAAPLTAQISFPPPATPPAGPARTRTATALPRSAKTTGSSSWALWLAVVLIAGAAVGVAVAYRRRRQAWLPVRPVVWPPTALPAATATLLLRSPPRALPPAPPAERAQPDCEPREIETGGDQPDDAMATAGPPARPELVLRLVGPFEVDGLRRPIRRRSVRRLLACLAMTLDRPRSADALAMAISDHPDRDPKPQSLHSYASILRQALPPGLLPDASPQGGYRLDAAGLVVDWAAIAAVADEPPTDSGWAERARAALELVRGEPLAGWSWEGVEPAVRLMRAGIEHVARGLADVLLRAGDPAGAEWAVTRGLAGAPGSVGLWQDRFDAAAGGSGYGLERAWTDAQTALRADAALLAAHYKQLRRRLDQQPTATA
jgi:hypothetical protein